MTELHPNISFNITNAGQAVPNPQSGSRSGGQTKHYPPRPRIATARPQPADRGQQPQSETRKSR